ncbi:MAG: hypothetical protein ACI4PF_01865 [Christensenellales bacterium]
MDKRKLLLLKYLLQKCDNGYKVLDTSKVLMANKKYKGNYSSLEQDINFLKSYKYVDVKYIDESNICLCVLDNTLIFQENLKSEKSTHKGYISLLLINILVSGVMAFLGAFLAIILVR